MLTSTERKCRWQKYVDPLNANLDEVEWPGFDKDDGSEKQVEFYDFSDDNIATLKGNIDEEFLRNLGKKIHSIRPLKVINTKMGLLTVTENAVADYHFDFWTLHTNFAISDDVAKSICDCPGVDAFIPMTRYRCRIGFPNSGLFDITQVKLEIQKRICNPETTVNVGEVKQIFNIETQEKITLKINELKSKGKYWALYVLPNGGMEVVESDTSNSVFKSKLQVFEESQKLVGGEIFKY